MKKLYFVLPVFLFIVIILPSCSKQSANQAIAPATPNVVNAIIAPNQAYTFTVNNSGNTNIEKQASHFKISKIELEGKTGQMVYQYSPAQDYTGKDEVVLSSKITIYSSEGGGGCNNSNHNNNSVTTSYSTSYTTIRLTISN